jgi:DNA-binding XRE family transcriptional regulator
VQIRGDPVFHDKPHHYTSSTQPCCCARDLPNIPLMTRYTNIYEPLRSCLARHPAPILTLTFQEMESMLGMRLPRSARTDERWWSNRRGSLQATAWLCADCRVVAVDFTARQVTFYKSVVPALRRIFGSPVWDRFDIRSLRRHMHLNQAAFAELIGVSQQMVSMWETGRHAPTESTNERLTLIAQQANFDFDRA